MASSETDMGQAKGQANSSNPSEDDSKAQNVKAEAAPRAGVGAKLKKVWAALGLDAGTCIIMGKGALPPTIAIALYQSDGFAQQYSTLGYLVAIISLLGMAIMPRAKFIQTMILNVFSICVGAAVALLEIYCVVRARQNTEQAVAPSPIGQPTAGTPTVSYNSSASAVAAIWLVVQIWAINTIRAKYPQFTFPVILYSIFTIVASSYAPIFPTMAAGESFARRLLEGFLTGFAIATGVSFLIFPMNSRQVIFKELTGYMMAMRGAFKANGAFFKSMEDPERFKNTLTPGEKDRYQNAPEAKAVKDSILGILALHGKIHGDMPFAKREIAFGKLGADDISGIFEGLKKLLLPIIGLSSVIDIFQKIGQDIDQASEDDHGRNRDQIVADWNVFMKALHEPFSNILEIMDEGIEHVMLTLELKKRPKKSSKDEVDIERDAQAARPGDNTFAEFMNQKVTQFHSGKQFALRRWCERRGIDLPPDFFEHSASANIITLVNNNTNEGQRCHQRQQRQLYLLLYLETLLYCSSKAVLDLVRFADQRVAHGKMSKTRLIVPAIKKLRKWLMSVFKEEDSSMEDNLHLSGETGGSRVYVGEAYSGRKDPEHLPPANVIEKLGNYVRKIPNFFRSSQAAFGLRVAVATMCIAIVGYLGQTQTWFIEERGLWAMIMVAISMNPTAGQGIFNFLLRLGGTALAMILAFLAWYIPGQQTAGIIVFVWILALPGLWVLVKKPQLAVVGIISVVTMVMIVGYELQVRKIGVQLASSNGQPYYPIYELGPIRLASVAIGLAVAFIWTIIPFPITEHSQLRQSLGSSLYLLANYYSIVHEQARARIGRHTAGEETTKGTPMYRLEKARQTVFAKQMLMINGLRTYSNFQKWEVPIGGRFPKEHYDAIIDCVQHIVNYMSLIGYASSTYSDPSFDSVDDSEWMNDFRKILAQVNITSHDITSMLSLLSASVSGGQPLPPYLETPKPYQLSARLEEVDSDILSIRHINEPGFAAFAVMQICTKCIHTDLEKLLQHVKALVGVLDFSFHTVSTTDSSSTASSDTLYKSSSEREKHE